MLTTLNRIDSPTSFTPKRPPDETLMTLGQKFEQAWIRERSTQAHYAGDRTQEAFAQAQRARYRTQFLARAILALRSQTISELYVRARALLWYSESLSDLRLPKRDRRDAARGVTSPEG